MDVQSPMNQFMEAQLISSRNAVCKDQLFQISPPGLAPNRPNENTDPTPKYIKI